MSFNKKLSRVALPAMAAVALLAAAQAGVQAAENPHANQGLVFGEPGNEQQKSRIVQIGMEEGSGEMHFSPAKVEVKKGEQVKFEITNRGELPHEFMLNSFEANRRHKAQMEKYPGMEHDDPNGKTIEPMKSAKLLWRFTKEGTFEFACFIPGHYEAGMKGVVVVK